MQSQMLDSEDNCLHINIRRDDVVIDAMQKAKNKKFDPRKLIQVIYCYQEYYVTLSATKSHCRLFIQVTFVGEGAIDHGGPRREFFGLLALETSKCNTTSNHYHSTDRLSACCKQQWIFVNYVTALQVSIELTHNLLKTYQNFKLREHNNSQV